MRRRITPTKEGFKHQLLFGLSIPLLAFLVVLFQAGRTSAIGTAQTTNIAIGDFFFAPQSVTIGPNATLTWTNQGQLLHTVTSPGIGDVEIPPGQQFSFPSVNTPPGTYNYFCRLHNSMTGSIIVTGAQPATATSTATNTATQEGISTATSTATATSTVEPTAIAGFLPVVAKPVPPTPTATVTALPTATPTVSSTSPPGASLRLDVCADANRTPSNFLTASCVRSSPSQYFFYPPFNSHEFEYILTGDIKGGSYGFNLWLGTGGTTTFDASIILRKNGVDSVLASTSFTATSRTYSAFSATVAGVDPDTASGDTLILKVFGASGSDAGMVNGPVQQSFITIPQVK